MAASHPTEEHPPPPPPGMTDEQGLVPPPPSGETQEHATFADEPSEVYEVPGGAIEEGADELASIAPESGEGPAPFDFEDSATGEVVVYEESYTEEEVVVYEEPVEPAPTPAEPASAADERDVLAEEEEEFADEVSQGAEADDDGLWFEQRPPEDFDFDEER